LTTRHPRCGMAGPDPVMQPPLALSTTAPTHA
jgi:hypothetical protein